MWDTIAPYVLGFAAWTALVFLWRWASQRYMTHGPGDTPADFLIWYAARLIVRVFHRAQFIGLEHAPASNHPGPLIVVANHTGTVDPFLLQAAVPFDIRWMMATETMLPEFDWLWKWRQIIPVDRDGKDLAAAREAIRHVKAGGVVGIFPEGRIVTPPQRVWPFAEGVGLIVSRTNAPVLLAWIAGTPPTVHPLPSIFGFSHARVTFLERIEFPEDAKPAEITRALREKIAAISSWPMTERGN